MAAFAMPVYMLDYTPKTISALLSPTAIEGKEVEVDVYDKNNLELKLQAKGQRVVNDPDLFKITTEYNGKVNEHDWNFTILRDSADRSRKKK